jgi:hypothetical protein
MEELIISILMLRPVTPECPRQIRMFWLIWMTTLVFRAALE